jgi:poly-gamma-glutamate capsule biosynthesis protein CapA/YwtB (metallophosphatase superfamily)
MNKNRLQVWQSPGREPISCRIAIAGDFLPAGQLVLPHSTGWGEQASRLANYFEGVDTSFVNLEGCLDVGRLPPRKLAGLGQIVSAPTASLEYLKAIRSHAIGVANNHSYDFGDEGVACTQAAIARCDMVSLGAGVFAGELPEIFVWQGPGGVRVGFWAAAKAAADLANGNRRGVEPATLARGTQAAEEMKRHGATFCVALLHAGCMRANRPDPEDVELMESLALTGFDLVAASHSHRIAGCKLVSGLRSRDAFCFFGLGSIVSGYVSSPLEREGLVVVAALSAEGRLVSLETRPVLIDATGFGADPSAADASMILDRFSDLSTELKDGSYEKRFYHEVSRGLGGLYLRDAHAAFRSAGLRGLAHKAAKLRMRHVRRFVHKVTG